MTARARKHLCGKQTCRGCQTCADPGPRGACGPCSRDVTSTAPVSDDASEPTALSDDLSPITVSNQDFDEMSDDARGES